MARDPLLLPGERLIWSSPRGKNRFLAPSNNPRVMMAMMFGGFYVLSMLFAAAVYVGVLASLLIVALLVAFGLWLRALGKRPAFFLSEQHLFARRRLGGFDALDLAKLRRCERYLARTYTRTGGIIETPTEAVTLHFENGMSRLVGPPQDFQGLWDLLQNGVLTHNLSFQALPSLDGAPTPAEKRDDLLFVLHTRTGGETYGPVFIGPTRLIRFTEPLPRLLEGTLLTLLASPQSAVEIEPQLGHLVRHPQAGHSLVIELGKAPITVDGTTLRVEREEREEEIELSARDAERAARFVAGMKAALPATSAG
jgi:hypothetical protein